MISGGRTRKLLAQMDRRWILVGVTLVLVVALVLAGIKVYRINQLIASIRGDLSEVKSLAAIPVDPEKLKNAEAMVIRNMKPAIHDDAGARGVYIFK